MKDSLTQLFEIPPEACDEFGTCKLSYLLKCMEDAAFTDSERLGQSVPFLMRTYGVSWMLFYSNMEYRMPPRQCEQLTVQTQYLGIQGVTVLRSFTLTVHGQTVLSALQSWVIVDCRTRTLCMPGKYPELVTEDSPNTTKNRRRFSADVDLQTVGQKTVLPSDLDINGHMNNVRYVEHAQEYLPAGCIDGFCRVRLLYRSELRLAQQYDCLFGSNGTSRQMVFRRDGEDCFVLEATPL